MNGLVAAGGPAGALLQTARCGRSRRSGCRRPGLCWKWHLRQRLASRSVSSLALTLPCGVWQVVQPSRMASCSNTYGPRWAGWHWRQFSSCDIRRVLPPRVGDALVRRMALDAGHLAFGHRMMAGQVELAAHIGMALEADGFRWRAAGSRAGARRSWSPGAAGGEAVRRLDLAAGIRVEAAGAVAGFAAGVERVGPSAISRAWSAVWKSR